MDGRLHQRRPEVYLAGVFQARAEAAVTRDQDLAPITTPIYASISCEEERGVVF